MADQFEVVAGVEVVVHLRGVVVSTVMVCPSIITITVLTRQYQKPLPFQFEVAVSCHQRQPRTTGFEVAVVSDNPRMYEVDR